MIVLRRIMHRRLPAMRIEALRGAAAAVRSRIAWVQGALHGARSRPLGHPIGALLKRADRRPLLGLVIIPAGQAGGDALEQAFALLVRLVLLA